MKNFIVFIVLLLAIPLAAAETQIFSGKVLTGTDKVLNEGTFRFTYDESSNKVFVQTPYNSMIILNGECKSNSEFKVCINGANSSSWNATTNEYYYLVDTIIYKLTGTLTATSKLSSDFFLRNQIGQLEVTISNPTDFDINRISYSEDLSPFDIRDIKGCIISGNNMSWQGSLKPNFDHSCTATFIADVEGTHNIAGNLDYFNGFEPASIKTGTASIVVLPRQLKVVQSLYNNPEVGQPFYFNLSITNINPAEKITFSAQLVLPDGIALLNDVRDFRNTGKMLESSSTFAPGMSANYSFLLKAYSGIAGPLAENFDYTIKDIRDVISNNTFINVFEPKPAITISPEYIQLPLGKNFIVGVNIKNPSSISDLTDIKAALNVQNNNAVQQSLGKLAPGDSYQIISSTFVGPKDIDSGQKSIKLEVSVHYTLNGIIKSANSSLDLAINNSYTKPSTPVINSSSQSTPAQNTPGNSTSDNVASIIKESVAPQTIKSNFLNKKSLLVVVILFIVLFIVPVTVFIIKRAKAKRIQQPLQNPQQATINSIEDNLQDYDKPKNI